MQQTPRQRSFSTVDQWHSYPSEALQDGDAPASASPGSSTGSWRDHLRESYYQRSREEAATPAQAERTRQTEDLRDFRQHIGRTIDQHFTKLTESAATESREQTPRQRSFSTIDPPRSLPSEARPDGDPPSFVLHHSPPTGRDDVLRRSYRQMGRREAAMASPGERTKYTQDLRDFSQHIGQITDQYFSKPTDSPDEKYTRADKHLTSNVNSLWAVFDSIKAVREYQEHPFDLTEGSISQTQQYIERLEKAQSDLQQEIRSGLSDLLRFVVQKSVRASLAFAQIEDTQRNNNSIGRSRKEYFETVPYLAERIHDDFCKHNENLTQILAHTKNLLRPVNIKQTIERCWPGIVERGQKRFERVRGELRSIEKRSTYEVDMTNRFKARFEARYRYSIEKVTNEDLPSVAGKPRDQYYRVNVWLKEMPEDTDLLYQNYIHREATEGIAVSNWRNRDKTAQEKAAEAHYRRVLEERGEGEQSAAVCAKPPVEALPNSEILRQSKRLVWEEANSLQGQPLPSIPSFQTLKRVNVINRESAAIAYGISQQKGVSEGTTIKLEPGTPESFAVGVMPNAQAYLYLCPPDSEMGTISMQMADPTTIRFLNFTF
jgi:hypothetical protein